MPQHTEDLLRIVPDFQESETSCRSWLRRKRKAEAASTLSCQMNSIDRHFRERERMKDLLVELSKRKPGGKTLRDMLM